MDSTTPQILFVSHDQFILKSLQQLLQDENWDCNFVSNAREALDFLQDKPIDLIVADTKLTDMDGIQFIVKIRKLYPGIVRIFLTGYAQQDKIIKAMAAGHVQQIIPKPWIDQELKEIIRSALRQSSQQKKHSPEFQALINSIPLLPALPQIYSNVRSCVAEDEIDIEKMAHYISQDVALSSVLLHWANSALFGQRFQVDTIKKAIIVLGTDIVENLILSESINKTVAGSLPDIEGFNLDDFSKHSMATAILSRLLIKSLLPASSNQHDRAFIVGLLHDMGKLVAASMFPAQLERSLAVANSRKCPLIEVEREIYGTDHAELGGFMAKWWTLPPFIVNAVYWHHQPRSTPIDQDIIAAVHVANLLSYQFNFGATHDTIQRTIADEDQKKFYLTEESNEIFQTETEQILRTMSK